MIAKVLRGLMCLSVVCIAAGVVHGQSDLCNTVDMKPVLSLQQVNQAEFVDYLVKLSLPPEYQPSPEGKTPEEYYQAEVRALEDAGFPPGLADVEPDRLVTRRYFASMMFPIAVSMDPNFAAKYGDVTDETAQLQALVAEDWMYAEEGRLYREELLSVLCLHQIVPPPQAGEEEMIEPTDIKEATLEAVLSTE